MRGLKSPDAVPWACTSCGHENPSDLPDGTCEICDANWHHGYDTWDEYQCDLKADDRPGDLRERGEGGRG